PHLLCEALAESSPPREETVATPKKMSLVQLTFIVAVNMMGSGIIMLPTNMAQVGAISLLSWGVTAVGSMAIAYGFAQAGLFNQRPGGMSAYAEDAYGKDGYFLVFFLYFLSLAMAPAAQNSDAVENPKRDVPLACLFGTLGAGVIYILSTTVIQGIVPNDVLAKSTGPFGTAYEHMFNPTVGRIIMVLAVLACLGSLLGWQFTIAQTGKAAAEERMFPKLFAKVNAMGAPLAGMLVLGVVQTVLALSTISPSLSKQFSKLVNLAVVTNVIPYIIALS